MYVAEYQDETLARAAVNERAGIWVLEFGANWCGWCIAAQPDIQAVLAARDDIHHEKIADGPGRPLGRSFRIKLWPTLVLIRDGEEVARVVRPRSQADIETLLAHL